MEVGLAVVVEMALGVILKFADGQMLKVVVVETITSSKIPKRMILSIC